MDYELKYRVIQLVGLTTFLQKWFAFHEYDEDRLGEAITACQKVGLDAHLTYLFKGYLFEEVPADVDEKDKADFNAGEEIFEYPCTRVCARMNIKREGAVTVVWVTVETEEDKYSSRYLW